MVRHRNHSRWSAHLLASLDGRSQGVSPTRAPVQMPLGQLCGGTGLGAFQMRSACGDVGRGTGLGSVGLGLGNLGLGNLGLGTLGLGNLVADSWRERAAIRGSATYEAGVCSRGVDRVARPKFRSSFGVRTGLGVRHASGLPEQEGHP